MKRTTELGILTILVTLMSLGTLGCGESSGTPADGGPDVDAGPIDAGPPRTWITDHDQSVNVGDFATDGPDNPDAPFDTIVTQAAAISGREDVSHGSTTEYLAREWKCYVPIQRIEVHGPSDGPFFSGGETGEVVVYGLELDHREWIEIARKPITVGSPSAPVVFEQSDLPSTAYVGHAVALIADAPIIDGGAVPGSTTARVAEVIFQGDCSGAESVFAWDVSDWECPVQCVAAMNPGTEERSVRCRRDSTDAANEAFCPSPKPDEIGGACSYDCPYVLSYIGDRDFTYSNGSGWLHEGNQTRRAGDLPHDVEHGSTVGEIEGQPCAILTTDPLTYFTGISCDEPAAGDYCAFQCLAPPSP